MNGRMPVVLLAACLLGSQPAAAQRPVERRCLMVLESSDREGVSDQIYGTGQSNYFVGGNVRMRCQQQNVRWRADSMAAFGGEFYQLITDASYEDDDIRVDADTLNYARTSETIQARGNVVVTNRINGSTLTGPSVDYLRAVRAVGRDSAEMIATGRPTVVYHRSPDDTSKDPDYTVTGNRLRAVGSSQTFADGDVEVIRDRLLGRGDSLRYFTSLHTDITMLFGAPARLIRGGEDSLDVTGSQIQLGLDGEALRSVRAQGDGRISSAGRTASGDDVMMEFEDDLLVRTLAWGRQILSMVVADGREVSGDSVVVVSPGERLRSVEAFGRATMREPPPVGDSLNAPVDSMNVEQQRKDDPEARETEEDDDGPIRNTITGQHIITNFIDHDSAGVLVNQVVDIRATGNATSLFSREVMRNGEASPTINYTRADTILVLMKTGDTVGVAEVRAFRGAQPVDGVQLERASMRRPAPKREEPL